LLPKLRGVLGLVLAQQAGLHPAALDRPHVEVEPDRADDGRDRPTWPTALEAMEAADAALKTPTEPEKP
jgi:hypothetical protein